MQAFPSPRLLSAKHDQWYAALKNKTKQKHPSGEQKREQGEREGRGEREREGRSEREKERKKK